MIYRPDIDGLRAIAILFVLCFHGGFNLFSSGFVGVDIFFVISGFLITGMVYEGITNNHFSFLEFYNRRLWRLQPVFFCLILCTTILSLLFYLPHDLLLHGGIARRASLFMSNHYLGRLTNDYFAPTNNELTLLHTWSLSIEWQFYLLFPLAIYSLHRIFARHYFFKIIYLLTPGFFVLSLYFSIKYPTQTYYQASSRIFEFLIGACIAYDPRQFSLNKSILNIVCVSALLTLFYIAIQKNIKLGFPNWYTLILCIATATLIAAGKHNPKPFVARILSVKPLVFVGLISYSLYIWHWPILAFLRYFLVDETTPVLLTAFSFIFFIAYLSWRFIEKPTQKFSKIKFRHTLVTLVIIPISLTYATHYLLKINDGYPQRFPEYSRINTLLTRYSSQQRDLCLLKFESKAMDRNCTIGAKGGDNKTAFMIGDSFSNQYWNFLDTLAKQANISVFAHSIAACLTLPNIDELNTNTSKIYKECREQTLYYYDLIKKNHYDYVIIGPNWNGYLSRIVNPINNQYADNPKDLIKNSLDEALQIITASGAKPILIKAIAVTTNNPGACFYKYIRRRSASELRQCDFYIQPQEFKWQNDLFSQMKNKYPQLIIIDPLEIQCPKGKCSILVNGVPIFRDSGHITDYAAYQFANIYLQHKKNPFLT